MILVATTIAIKYNEDIYFCNKTYAKIGGITLNELNYLESEFFRLIKHELYVNDLYYNNCYNYFLKELPRITYFDEKVDDNETLSLNNDNSYSKINKQKFSSINFNKKSKSILL